jgi:hypothetical protein
MIPDISSPLILIRPVVKYAVMPNEKTKKVSMMGLVVTNLQCLNIRASNTPKMSPIATEMIPRSMN